MAKEETDSKKRTKQTTAKKREMQSIKKKVANKVFKSQVRTSIRRFEDALAKGEAAVIQESLNNVYALMDKGVKKGIYKINKASRTKSRLTARVAAKA